MQLKDGKQTRLLNSSNTNPFDALKSVENHRSDNAILFIFAMMNWEDMTELKNKKRELDIDGSNKETNPYAKMSTFDLL